jgi:hypothetical protein
MVHPAVDKMEYRWWIAEEMVHPAVDKMEYRWWIAGVNPYPPKKTTYD